MALNQCAQFCNNTYRVHERDVICIAKYLRITSTYTFLPDGNRRLSTWGVFYWSDIEKRIECYSDDNFSSGWDQADAYNEEIVMSRSGYVIAYMECLLLWCSKLHK